MSLADAECARPDHLPRIARAATESGQCSACPDYDVVAVPDLVLLEAAANGLPVPPSHSLRFSDGTSATFYRRPLAMTP